MRTMCSVNRRPNPGSASSRSLASRATRCFAGVILKSTAEASMLMPSGELYADDIKSRAISARLRERKEGVLGEKQRRLSRHDHGLDRHDRVHPGRDDRQQWGALRPPPPAGGPRG